MKAGYRAEALTLAKLAAAEKHGKRLDETSQKRRVRDAPALVYGSLDLREAFDQHVADARMNKALKKPVLHALIQFPNELKLTPENEERMLRAAVEFVNRTHGGDAVFAARLDRDEAGRHTVDVFFSPKYEKQTKRKGAETWISTTKHGKELALKHADEIRRRSPKARDVSLTSPRAVGIAMQTELAVFLAEKGLKLEPRREKTSSKPDRVDPETFKARSDAKKAKAEVDALREAAKRDAAHAASARAEAEGMRAEAAEELKHVQTLKERVQRAGRALSELFRSAAAKLGVESQLDALRDALKQLEISEKEQKQQQTLPENSMLAAFERAKDRGNITENSRDEAESAREEPREEPGPGF